MLSSAEILLSNTLRENITKQSICDNLYGLLDDLEKTDYNKKVMKKYGWNIKHYEFQKELK